MDFIDTEFDISWW